MNKYYFISCTIRPNQCGIILYNCVISESIHDFINRNYSKYHTFHVSSILEITILEYRELKSLLNNFHETYLKVCFDDLNEQEEEDSE